ncbi:MAG: hypothetical protein ACPHF4_03065 [Rubripirellula sp.]
MILDHGDPVGWVVAYHLRITRSMAGSGIGEEVDAAGFQQESP